MDFLFYVYVLILSDIVGQFLLFDMLSMDHILSKFIESMPMFHWKKKKKERESLRTIV